VTSAYRRGADVERLILARLTADGCWPTIRSAGSKGVVDVVAYRAGITYAVQIKRGCWPGADERRALGVLAGRTNWVVLAARWEPRRPTRWARIHPDGSLAEQRPLGITTDRPPTPWSPPDNPTPPDQARRHRPQV
jgi:hypothetical protein